MNININSVWKTVSDPQCNISGVWKKIKGGYGNIGGVWKQLFSRLLQLYTAGVQNVAWTYTDSYATLETDHVYFYVSGGAEESSDGLLIAQNIDVTNYSTLHVDSDLTLCSSTSSGQVISCGLAQLRNSVIFSRQVKVLDISSISGSATLTIDYIGAEGTKKASGNVYNVWLE